MSKSRWFEKHVTVRLDESFYHEVSDKAHELRTTRAGLFREAMEHYLKALEKAESLAA